ncbi:hypothetical protein V6N13_130330 [Hibiscus sabdariffa]
MEKRPPPETIQIRLLCPSAKTGALIGKGGSVIRQLQSLTSTKIRILDDPFEERIIQIVADNKILVSNNADNPNTNVNADPKQDSSDDGCNSASGGGGGGAAAAGEEETTSSWSPLQKAVVRVFERIVKGDAADDKETEKESENLVVCCRMLLAYNQAACLLGRGGWFLEKIGYENGTQIRVLTRDQILPCAAPGDELLQSSRYSEVGIGHLDGSFKDQIDKVLVLHSGYLDGLIDVKEMGKIENKWAPSGIRK